VLDLHDITEELVDDSQTGETYIALSGGNAELLNKEWFDERAPAIPLGPGTGHQNGPSLGPLKFIPYYFRGNRGGKGHMRVGLRMKS
jgi:hypothetical protein